MRFRDLGPVAVEEDGIPVPLSGSRLWAVLAVLLINARSTVSSERIVDAVWGDDPPARPTAALDSLLWRLRRTLEPGRSPRGGSGVVQTTGNGYLLAVADDDIDSRRFLLEAGQAAGALRRSDPAAALVASEAALDRWRGHPFDGVRDSGWLTPERERLRQAWIEVAETRVQALLELGLPEQSASEAGALLTDHPYREHLWAQRMLGLYRAGRQADALAAFEQARRILADELGVDPGPELNTLQAAILAQDPTLWPTEPLPIAPAPPGRARRPPRSTRLFGRDNDLAAVSALLARGHLVTLTGPMGVGKTALATALAADQVFVDLTAVADEAGLLAETAAALGLGTVATDPRTLVIDRLRTSGALLVLDNCEQILREVDDLVAEVTATAPQVRILATSREPLDLPGELVHRLAPLPPGAAATDLFLDRLGHDLDAAESDRVDLIDTICAAVGGLPLGIELAARRARSFRLEEIADSVRLDPGGLARDPRSPRTDRTLAAAIEDSHRLLSVPEQLAHRQLSVLAAPFTVTAAAAVLDRSTSPAMDLVAALVHRSLLTVEQTPGRATRFRQLVPLRADGHERLVAVGELAPVEQRRASWMAGLLEGPRRGRPGQREWYEQIEADFPTVVLTIDTELGRPGDAGALLAVGVQGFCYDRNRTAQGLTWLSRAAALDGLGPFARAAAQVTYGAVLTLTRQAARGRPYLDRGLTGLLSAAADHPAQAAGVLVDAAAACWVGDQNATAGRLAGQARLLAERAGARHEADLAEAVEVAASLFTSDPESARRRALELINLNRLQDNGQAQLFAYATAGIAAIPADPEAGLRWTAESLRTAQRIGARNLGGLLEQRAGHLLRAGRPEDAVRCLAASAAHAAALGEAWPSHPGTTAMIDALHSRLPAALHQAADAAGHRIVEAHGIDVADWL